ncbi:excisionase family DNA binding protein [Ancylomarina subtilis]|jgi:excisionase family DNA binding protein|uniref:Excisionase family DNA binding protein n=1 Tax=Ancylomarina subtilis TaxID=1639035 RepID=A0A4Q7VIM9_9BACT|nr:helix-turn-helix domain-containing protein [Ancylomarina subtilis]RZT96016.1 excisionase family DNA binding protein [Ancylomarina subtilis]
MNSTIELQKICEHCGKEFTAKTTVTRFCNQKCAAKSYKKRKRENKVGRAIVETNKQKLLSVKDLHLEAIKQKDFLSIKEAYTLLGVSERTFYRLMKAGTIQATKLGKRTIIKRSVIDKLFQS